jgi:hypothetical protein
VWWGLRLLPCADAADVAETGVLDRFTRRLPVPELRLVTGSCIDASRCAPAELRMRVVAWDTALVDSTCEVLTAVWARVAGATCG